MVVVEGVGEGDFYLGSGDGKRRESKSAKNKNYSAHDRFWIKYYKCHKLML